MFIADFLKKDIVKTLETYEKELESLPESPDIPGEVAVKEIKTAIVGWVLGEKPIHTIFQEIQSTHGIEVYFQLLEWLKRLGILLYSVGYSRGRSASSLDPD